MNIDFNLHARQSDCFSSKATEILYGGAAGGGKSHCMRVLALYYAINVSNIQIYLFRRLSEDLKKNHLDGSSGFVAILGEMINRKLCSINYSTAQISFYNGSKIHLCHCQHEKDVIKYQGVEINVLLIDELTHFSEYIYKFLRGRVRLGGLNVPKNLIGNLPRIVAGSNPGGVGHEFVKSTFIDNKEPFTIYKTNDEEGGMTRQFIPAKLEDNPTMMDNDPSYKYKLLGLGGALAKAMLDGDWEAIEGAYFDTFDKNKHIIAPFNIPQHWHRVRGFDWGYSRPFCTLWAAVSDGSLVEIDGVNRSLPPNSLVFYKEYYGTSGKANEGLKLTAGEIAHKIKDMDERVDDYVADPAIFDVSIGTSINEQMNKFGIYWRPADNKRVAGWQQMRERLKGDKPLLYITTDCKNLIRTIPLMIYDKTKPEDLDTSLEDHALDTARYICMSRPIVVSKAPSIDDEVKHWYDNFNPANIITQSEDQVNKYE